ncbi:uncharacterized protein LOC125046770 [Penaeus chinensis]|uniref:uncharacterized protein LOC125046770 n=1 Tax=Penaeus chinensis TaxID=139456 RepID=UPI001FB5B288|nr:uncharacterized protein LOC125046770 [Penaeus chinensis]
MGVKTLMALLALAVALTDGCPIDDTPSTPSSSSEGVTEGPQPVTDGEPTTSTSSKSSEEEMEEEEEKGDKEVDAQRTYGKGRPKGPFGYYGFFEDDKKVLGTALQEKAERDAVMTSDPNATAADPRALQYVFPAGMDFPSAANGAMATPFVR